MGNQVDTPHQATPLHYAPSHLRRPKSEPAFGLAFAGTFLSYFVASAAAAWSGLVIDHIVAANGFAGAVLASPKLSEFERRAIEVPAVMGLSCILIVICLFTFQFIRRRAGLWFIGGFILINLFAILFMLVSLDMGAIEHGLYP